MSIDPKEYFDVDNLIDAGTSAVQFVGFGIAAAVVIPLLIVAFFLFRAWYQVPKADEAIVIVGKKQRSSSGESSSMTVLTGGGAFVNKLTQRSTSVSLRSRQIKMEPVAQTNNGVTINVAGVAMVKIGSEPGQVRAAAERFASQDKAIDTFITEQLEGALRGVVAKLSVEEVMKDRQKLGDEIADGIKGDLLAQGLVLDSFAIQGVTDSNGYISALGAKEVERVKREADIAQIDASRLVKQSQIATAEANLVEQTALDKNSALAKAEVGRANAEAEQAENLARAQAEQAVLQQNAENKQAQLDADVKRVADAEKYEAESRADAEAYKRSKQAEATRLEQQQIADAEAYTLTARAESRRAAAEAEAAAVKAAAQAEAESIRLVGEAKAQAIEAEARALAENQEALLSRQVIDLLPQLLGEFAKGYANVGEITLIGGESAAAHMAGEQAATLRATFDAVRATTGLDLSSVISGRALGRGIAEGAEPPIEA